MKRPRPGFTLIELLVVITIIALVSVAVLPTVLPAIQHRQVSESARLVQAAIEGARDAAVRANAPRGVRLLADPAYPGSTTDPTAPLAFSRLIAIEPAPDYREGRVSIRGDSADPPSLANGAALRLEESRVDTNGFPNPRTSWHWNLRVGDRIQIGRAAEGENQAGLFYTVVGPVVESSPERFVNLGPPGTASSLTDANGLEVEYLFLVNGGDDDGDGWTDEGYDGVDNDGDGTIDELDEWEQEHWNGEQAIRGATNDLYVVRRRPYPTQGARVVELPSGVVIDATTWATTRERSHLPIDPESLACEFLVLPSGAIVPAARFSSPSSADVVPFFHLWIAERGDLIEPAATGVTRLPEPKGEARVITVNTRSGLVATSDPAGTFDAGQPHAPFYAARGGERSVD